MFSDHNFADFFSDYYTDSVMEKYIRFIFSVIILAVIAEPVVILIRVSEARAANCNNKKYSSYK